MTAIETRRRVQRGFGMTFALALGVSGVQCTCANSAYHEAYTEKHRARVATYRHQDSVEAVVADIEYVWRGQRLRVVEPSSGFEAQTDWNELPETRERFFAQVRPEPDGIAVRIEREHQRREPPVWGDEERRVAVDRQRAVALALAPSQAQGLADDELADFVHEVSPRVLFDEVRRNAADAYVFGFETQSPPIASPAQTAWVESMDRSTRTRLETRLVPTAGGHRLSLWEVEQHARGPRSWEQSTRTRWYAHESALIAERDPKASAAIDESAREAGQRAFEQAKARGAVSCSDFCELVEHGS